MNELEKESGSKVSLGVVKGGADHAAGTHSDDLKDSTESWRSLRLSDMLCSLLEGLQV